MALWNELLDELNKVQPHLKPNWIKNNLIDSLKRIQNLREDRNVLLYATAFLQKPNLPPISLSITSEEINGYMTTLNGMDWEKGLTLILHTPGGVTNAAETIVEYLRSKFKYLEVIIPTYAMSAGTMISLASNNIIMGRQSQLGPIDPQMPANGKFVSSLAIIDQFETAKKDVHKDIKNAHVWAPILPSLGPALISEAKHAIEYSEKIVSGWLSKHMFKELENADSKAETVARYFSRSTSKISHGRRISREEAASQGLYIENLEDNQDFQDAVLTNYHLITLMFEQTPLTKLLMNERGIMWVKQFMNKPPQSPQTPVLK